jgi:small GTP-binding protein
MNNSFSDKIFINLNILLVGDANVGKTSILLKYTENFFPNQYQATIGVEYKMKIIKLNNMNIKLQIWDTAGQERYKSIAKNFFHSANGVFLVFDITNKKSFENLNKWIEDVKENSPKDCKYIIIGNKSDLSDQRTISTFEIDNFVKEKKSSYFEVSAKNDEGLNDAFINLSKEIIKDKNQEEIYQFYGHKNSIIIEGNNKKCCF